MKRPSKKILWISLVILVSFGLIMYLVLAKDDPSYDTQPGLLPVPVDKPVIYLYPEEVSDIYVKLQYDGEIIASYPDYDKLISGWQVNALPDGSLINKNDQKEYSYIFWEGVGSEYIDWDLSTGFVVRGSDTREFLQNTLEQIGLTPKEYNEFIVYWYPKMMENEYNLIHFAGKQYTDTAVLTVEPQPDSILRVFMVYKAIDEPINIQPQDFKPFNREGFTVVEWGGSEIE